MSDLINGKYFAYLVHRYRTKKQLKSIKSRFNRDLNNLNDPFENGVFNRPQDVLYERPSKIEVENIFLYAANTENQLITINLHWNPIADENCGLIRVNFKLFGFGGDQTIYQYKRSERIYNLTDYHDYSVGGFKLEIFSPLKRIKVRLNDFCSTIKNNSNKQSVDYQFIRCIAIVVPVQEIFDNLQQFDSKFISKQLTSVSQSFPFIDCTDISSHVRLLITIGEQLKVETNLWGLRSKLRYNQDSNYKNCQLIKFSGYAMKKGYNFSITLIELNGQWFINGFSSWGIVLVFPIVILTDPKQLIDCPEKVNFTLGNKYRLFKVTGKKIDLNQPFYSITVDNCPGIGHYIRLPFTGNESDFDCKIVDHGPLIGSIPDCPSSSSSSADLIVVTLDQPLSMNSKLTGGKGSSLAKLKSIVIDYPQLGQIPKGIVITTKAYELMSKSIGLQRYIDQLKCIISDRKRDESKLENECNSVVNLIGSIELPETIKQSIITSLNQLFDSNWINNKQLAIRSSAFGEDSTELSCAGQMETFLGITTLEQIFQCIMKCWASQFRFIAINYKLLNGLDLNLPMAVVIQEMIDCDSAGVLFTCDPVTGNQLTTLITANYGLGESIVSSTCDPDTIKVKLEITSNGLTIDSIEEIKIGGKEKIIKLDSKGEGTITIESQLRDNCCLNENQIINLTSTCLKFASFFNGPVDIEWGIQSDTIYLFQCRPVTTISSTQLTDWELNHEIDSAHVGSNEYHTRANLGEVYPGTTSYICHDFQIPSSTIPIIKNFYSKMKNFRFTPYVARGMVFCQHHSFFALKDGVMFVYDTPPDKENKISTSMEYSMLGQKIDDYEMKADSYERLSQLTGQSKLTKLTSLLELMIMGPRRLRKETFNQFQSKVDSNSTSHQMFKEIVMNPDYIWDAFFAHLNVTIGSSIMNLLAISILSGPDENSPTILTDFSKLLASCEQVVSAQIPVILRELGSKVLDENEKNLILNLTDQQFEDYLKSGTSELAVNYRKFITNYGHRGWKEFDFAGTVWRKDASVIINPLRSLIKQQTATTVEIKPDKVTISDDELIDSLDTPLSKVSRFLLKQLVLPWCRKYVCLREEGKNKLVWKIDQMRKLFDQMAVKLSHDENRLPDPNLAYYLTPDELYQLTQTANPGLVLLAKRRQKILQKSDSYEFPVILIGPKMLPNNLPSESDDDDDDWINGNGHEVIGTPVSQGKVKSTVFVARNLQDAAQIKPGDILITYSTDIGWSPYFPIISGLITEIGGLISHGAVIAREFGLPCVVGVTNACKIFKSGEIVSMDANKGIVTKLTK